MMRTTTAIALSAVLLVGQAVPASAAPVPVTVPDGLSVTELDLAGVASDELAALPEDAPVPSESLDVGAGLDEGTGAATAVAGAQDDSSADATSDATAPEAAEAQDAPQPDEPLAAARVGAGDDAATVPADALATAVLTEQLDSRPFSVVGITWDRSTGTEDVVVRYRVREAGTWTEWAAASEAEQAPDDGSRDAQSVSGDRVASEPIVVQDADGIQVWAQSESGALTGLKAVLVDPGEDPAAMAQTQVTAPGVPAIVTRAQWGADESQVTCGAEYATSMVTAAVHHTASTNAYGPDEVPGILRGILAYHTRPEGGGGRGWCDIGYNFLVDRFGRIFEGRHGGIDKPVVGVHTGGFNSRTLGVSAIGEYGTAGAPAALVEAISQLLAWRFGLARIDAAGTEVLVSGGGASKYPAGTPVRFSTIYAHRDAQLTSCPGQNLYDQLPAIRSRVVQLSQESVRHSPVGVLDGVTTSSGKVRVSGWAIDPDHTGAVAVHVYVGASGVPLTANQARADVAAHRPEWGPLHGFDASIPVAAGRHVVCAYALDDAGASMTVLGCRTVTVQASDPVGRVDEIRPVGTGLRVAGWAFDPDTTQPIAVHVYVDGTGYALTADGPSPAVQAAFPKVGPNHAYATTVPVTPGRHRVCVYAINAGAGATTVVECRSVDVPVNVPVGRVDQMRVTGSGLLVSGWAFDADTTAPIGVHVYVDGTGYALTAGGPSPLVAAAFPGVGRDHAYSATVPVTPGRHRVCVYGINVGPGTNTVIECRDVDVPVNVPVGRVDSMLVRDGELRVAGWAFDADTTAPIALHLYVDATGYPLTAGRPSPLVAAAFPGTGPDHAFQVAVPVTPGRHRVCLYGINVGPGTNTVIECRDVP